MYMNIRPRQKKTKVAGYVCHSAKIFQKVKKVGQR